jgi:hypothetical protein
VSGPRVTRYRRRPQRVSASLQVSDDVMCGGGLHPERPVEADTREVAGHWEGDLVFGTRTSAVATLVDRATRYAMGVALPDGRKAEAVARALIEQMGRLRTWRSLTWDRGLEMAHHAAIIRGAVLLRPAPSLATTILAARHQRGHQLAAAPISAQERRPGQVQPGPTQLCRGQTQPPPPGGCSAGSPRPKRSIGTSRRGCLRLRSRCDCGLRSWPHDRRRGLHSLTSPASNVGVPARLPSTSATRSASNATSLKGI